MKHFIKHYFLYFLAITFTFFLESCASKKQKITINKEVITKEYKDNSSSKNILYIIDGKEVSESFMQKLDTSKIKSMTVFKGEKEVSKYTDKKYDGVIVIKMKQ